MFEEHFIQFWTLYPRKTGKLAAYEVWLKMAKKWHLNNGNFDSLMETLRKQIEYDYSKKEKQFIPLPVTWLRQGRWMDEVEEETRPEWLK